MIVAPLAQLLAVSAAPTVVELLERFTAFVRGEGSNPVRPEEGIVTTRLIEQIYAAAQTGS